MQFLGTHHVALCTPNFAALRQFYAETLGLPVVGGFPGRNIIFINAGTAVIELIERQEPLELARQGWAHFAFHVADCDATYAELNALGVPFHNLPRNFPEDKPTVRIAFFKDPDGNELELVQSLIEGFPQQF